MRLLVLALACLWGPSSSAANIFVTTNADEFNADGDCSLREAIRAANTNTAVDGCTAGDDQFESVILNSIVGQTITLALGQIEITGGVLISAFDTVTIDAAGTGRVFSIDVAGPPALVRVARLTLRGGTGATGGAVFVADGETTEFFGVTFDANTSAGPGGALRVGTGTHTVEGCTFTGNATTAGGAAQGGGAIYNAGGQVQVTGGRFLNNTASVGMASGGAILNGPGGALRVSSVFTENRAARSGGAIETAGSLIGTNGQYVSNTAGASGGAVHMTGAATASFTTYNSFRTNAAGLEGGALWLSAAGTLDLRSVEIQGNTAAGPAADQGGGGLYSAGGVLTMENVTLRENRATGAAGSGGGLLNTAGGRMTLLNCSLVNNAAVRAGGGIETVAPSGTTGNAVEMANTAVSGNDAGSNPGFGGGIHVTGAGAVTVSGGSVGDNTAVAGGGLWIGAGGALTMTGTLVSANQATGNALGQGGGGLYLDGGTATVSRATFTLNSATGTSGAGGALLNGGGVVAVRATSFTENQARRSGGAVEEIARSTPGGPASTYVRVTLSGNQAGSSAGASPGDGGAFHLTGAAEVRVDSSAVSRNRAVTTGGAFRVSEGGLLIVTATSVEENTAARGGAVFKTGPEGTVAFYRSLIASNTASVAGGGVYAEGGRVGIQICTLSGNRAPTGAGLFNAGGSALLIDATVTGNVATTAGGGVAFEGAGGQTVLTNSILADNDAPAGADCAGFLLVTGANLVETTEGCDVTGTVTLSGVGPALLPLADNGGATRTHALVAGSPAAFSGQTPSPFDQRGYTRGAPQSIGAYEFGGVVVAGEPGVAGAPAGFALSAAVPNPSRGAATVRFTAGTSEPVELALYDTIGRRIRTLYAGAPGASAVVEVAVDGSSLPPGVYVVRLTGASGTATRRLTVIR